MTPEREDDIKRTFNAYRSKQWYGPVLRLPKVQSVFHQAPLGTGDVPQMNTDIFEYTVCKDVLYERGKIVAKRYRVMCENVVVDELIEYWPFKQKSPPPVRATGKLKQCV